MYAIPIGYFENAFLFDKGKELIPNYKISLTQDKVTFLKPPEKLRKQIHTAIHKPLNRPDMMESQPHFGGPRNEYEAEILSALEKKGIDGYLHLGQLVGLLAFMGRSGEFKGVGMLPEFRLLVAQKELKDHGVSHLPSLGTAATAYLYRAAMDELDGIVDDAASASQLFKRASEIAMRETIKNRERFDEVVAENYKGLSDNVPALIEIVSELDPLVWSPVRND